VPDDVVKALKVATDKILAEAVAKDPVTKKVNDSYMAYKAKYDAWADLSETVYHNKIRKA
jgi:TRAP-type mannitol/chloroaromatic compound transport system substrate-binding protein